MFMTEHSYGVRIVHLVYPVGIPEKVAAVATGGTSLSKCLATIKLRPASVAVKKFILKLAPLWGTAKVGRFRFTKTARKTLLLRGLPAA